MDRAISKGNVYWFAYYRHASLVSMDEITNGLVWRRVEELPHGFFTREDAIAWLEFLASDKLIEMPQRTSTTSWNGSRYSYKKLEPEEPMYRFTKDSAYFYKIFPAGIMYMDAPAPDAESPWNVGVMRELAGYPRPESVHPPRRSKLRIAIQGRSAASGEYIVEI